MLTREKAHERSPLQGNGVADCALKNRKAGLERVDQRSLRRQAVDLELDFQTDTGEGPQVRRKDNPDHGKVWTSTDRTAGKSLTMGAQLSPELAEA